MESALTPWGAEGTGHPCRRGTWRKRFVQTTPCDARLAHQFDTPHRIGPQCPQINLNPCATLACFTNLERKIPDAIQTLRECRSSMLQVQLSRSGAENPWLRHPRHCRRWPHTNGSRTTAGREYLQKMKAKMQKIKCSDKLLHGNHSHS